jgi:hypothetical protein
MFSVVNDENYDVFLKHNINVSLPRGSKVIINGNIWNSFTILDFEEKLIKNTMIFENLNILIDCANGNNPKLHNIIKISKKKYGDSLKIMSGNISSKEAFIELANSGCDYIRIGIGGSSSCNTSSNTGVGQENLGDLITECFISRETGLVENKDVKIVADGISSYINYCMDIYGFLDNGYATINKLLYLGSDIVMIGKLFAQCDESSGEKYINDLNKKLVKYQGMSTKEAQNKYNSILKHSEGNTNLIEVKWSLNEWLNGSENQSDYLPGYINCLKSAMAYTGSETINDFIGKNNY